jgi:hypothetical protein
MMSCHGAWNVLWPDAVTAGRTACGPKRRHRRLISLYSDVLSPDCNDPPDEAVSAETNYELNAFPRSQKLRDFSPGRVGFEIAAEPSTDGSCLVLCLSIFRFFCLRHLFISHENVMVSVSSIKISALLRCLNRNPHEYVPACRTVYLILVSTDENSYRLFKTPIKKTIN